MPHLPSPSSSASLSPPAGMGHRMVRQHSCSEDDSDQAARSALEIRREKNRIKQRNLRLRRANQMADLERTVQSMRGNTHELEDRIAALEAHQASLAGWVRDLEAALIANGQREHVESLRRMWNASAPPTPSEPMSQQSSVSNRDPLATLASAAASSFRPGPDQPRWEDEANARKRRRQDDEYAASLQQHHAAAAARLPSPSRAMRIDQLCLPLPRPSPQSPSSMISTEPWGWGHLPSLDHSPHGFHQYESKPRVTSQSSYDQKQQHKPRVSSASAPQDPHRSISPPTARPLSAGSSEGTARSWTSPTHSFDVRL